MINRLNNLKITTKLVLTFVVVGVGIVLVGWLGLKDIKEIEDSAEVMYRKHLKGITHLTKIAENYSLKLSKIRDIILISNSSIDDAEMRKTFYVEQIEDLESKIDKLNIDLEATLVTDSEKTLFKAYLNANKGFRKEKDYVLDLVEENTNQDLAVKMLYGKLNSKSEKLRLAIDNLIAAKEEIAAKTQEQNSRTVEEATGFLLWVVVAALLFMVLVAVFVYYNVSVPIVQLTRKAKAVSVGDFSIGQTPTSRKDEIGRVIKSFNRIISNLGDSVKQADAIANGDYSTHVQVRGSKDKLGIALTEMNNALRDQNWRKDGINKLNITLSGHFTLKQTAEKTINFLGSFMEMGYGVLYIFDQENQSLKLLSSYAFIERDTTANEFHVGEGIIGQVAFEKKPIVLKNIHNPQGLITSGTVSRAPLSIFAFPLLYEEELCGVIELASFDDFTPLHREFVEEASEIVASHIYSAMQGERIQALLTTAEEAKQEAQQKAKEVSKANTSLRAQQEKLQQQAEELQQQTEEMQQQSEELQQTNEELQQQQEQLEKQSAELQVRNAQLNETKADLERQKDELEQSSRYKSEFLANMSHELRTPLNSIILLSDMLRRNSKKNLADKEVQKAGIIYQSGNDLLNLINDLLDISKIEAGKMVVNIHHFYTRELKEELQGLFEEVANQKKLKFIINDELDAELINDKDKVAQVMKNFLSNAFKFTKSGSVTLSFTKHDDPELSVKISVKDTGVGIPADKQALIFEAFQQADGSVSREFGGTGLGLSIAREMSKLLGGEVNLKSEYGKGSEFYLLLPIKNDLTRRGLDEANVEVLYEPKDGGETIKISSANDPSQEIRKAEERKKQQAEEERVVLEKLKSKISGIKVEDDKENVSENDKVILIIEDSVDYANSLAEISRSMNFKAIIATQASEGYEYIEKYNPAGVLLDIGLPDMRGDKLLEKIKANPAMKHIPINIVSAKDKNLKLLHKGAVGYLQKPVEADKVKSAVTQLVGISEKRIKDLLIVEDNNVHRNLILELFEKEGVKCYGVSTEQAARNALDTGNYDAVVVDLDLEEGSGLGLCRYIQEKKINIPAIIYTGKDLSAAEKEELHLYSVGIIIKSAESYKLLVEKSKLFLHQVSENQALKQRLEEVKRKEEQRIAEENYRPVRLEKEGDEKFVTEDLEHEVFEQHKKQEATGMIINSDLEEMLEGEDNEGSSQSLKGKSILIVDDDIRNVFVLTSALENHEANIIEALNGQEALEVLEEESVDLILMDIMMPVMDGYETMGRIRKSDKYKDVPIIAVTAKALPEDRQKCLDAGADNYLTKPVDYRKLLELIKEQLGIDLQLGE